MSWFKKQKVDELNQLAAEEGITLPYSAEVIANLEAGGKYVDLATGFIYSDGERVELTVVGEATAVVNRSWLDD